nr:reverse transcriptase domain-containing protein [Tanacetum cinerariifolium]
MEPRLKTNKETTPPLRLRSLVVRRQRERIVGFEEAPIKEGNREEEMSKILGLHKEQRISGFGHGLRTRSLVEHLSTDLPSTYKGLMEKTYTWIEAREVATNGALNERRKTSKGIPQNPNSQDRRRKNSLLHKRRSLLLQKITLRFKNAGATYQRLIDKVFNHQLGRNMEVNTNDIVIKSNIEEEMLADIKETLDRLQAINPKLNPKKCSFGVEDGIFSRHLVTKQGIKVNPSKVKAILDLQPPKSVSKKQNINRKLAALNSFLSKRADKTLPFMRTLKNCTSGKMVQ